MYIPKISIITPCYNMERFIELTIQSIIFQDYPNLEYIIVDGGSTDHSIDIINKYKSKISIIISEPDQGMYDAIDKGIKSSTGDILAWLNADDSYFPWTLKTIARIFAEHDDINWIIGIPAFFDEERYLTNIYTHAAAKPAKAIANGWFRKGIYGYLQQESMFWRRNLYFKSGGLDVNFKFAGDFELWTRFALYSDLVTVALPLAAFMKRKSGLSIGSPQKYQEELDKACIGKKKYPSVLWSIAQNSIIMHLLRLLTRKKSRLCFYSTRYKTFLIKTVKRSVSSNTLSEMRYENIFKKYLKCHKKE
ncbi:MAG: glycosyltransferase [Bacteroidales bacterium]|nr:glycosyltransferase [Bacteroidales bacterium]